MTSRRRLRHIAAASTGTTKNTTIRVMLPPMGLATRNNGTAAAAAMPAASRSTRSDDGSTITRPMHDAITPTNAAPRNGNTPGSGKSAEAAAIGVMVSSAIVIGMAIDTCSPLRRRNHASAMMPPSPIARNAPATGLASEVSGAATTATNIHRRSYAVSATRPNARPSANGSRPTARLTAVPTANQHAANAPIVPKRRWSRSANAAAAITLLAIPTTIGPNHEASGG